MLLRDRYITSNASRNFVNIKLLLFNLFYYNKLKINSFKNKSIDIRGRKLIYHKKKTLFKSKIITLNKNKYLINPSFIDSIVYSFSYKKFYNFMRGNCGIRYYYNSSGKLLLFSYFFFDTRWIRKRFNLDNFYSFIGFFEITDRVSNLRSIKNNFFYSTSSGCFSYINYIDRVNHLSIIKLPSKELKYFSMFDTCNNKGVSFAEKRDLSFSKAGYKMKINNKSKVRGVAKNPVDHPHGGNTKSIRFPRTPWGKPTKLK